MHVKGLRVAGMIVSMMLIMSAGVFAEPDVAPAPTTPVTDQEREQEEMKRLNLIKQAYLIMDKYYYKPLQTVDVGNLFYRCQFIMMSLLRDLNENYLMNLDRLTYSSINMIVEALKDPSDKYSKFIYKDYLQRTVREHLKSSFTGIGIEVERKDKLFFVANVYAESSAAEMGVLVSDRVLAVRGTSVEDWELEQLEKALDLKEGDSIEMTFQHPDAKEPYTVMLVSRTIWIPSVNAKYYADQRIGYIAVMRFRDLTSREFHDTLTGLQTEPLTGLIIDLRGNSGGDETQAIQLASMFLPKGSLVVYFMKKDVGRREERTQDEPVGFPYPIVILVNKDTASSSEMFSGALRYYKKAVIVGTTTMGMGSLKNTFGLNDGSALFLITSRTYLPDDQTYDQIGLAPDIVVEEPDAQLAKAFEILKGMEQIET